MSEIWRVSGWKWWLFALWVTGLMGNLAARPLVHLPPWTGWIFGLMSTCAPLVAWARQRRIRRQDAVARALEHEDDYCVLCACGVDHNH